MELLRLKRRLALARRGHQLLRDKLDELMREFLKLVRKEEKVRQSVEERFISWLKKGILTASFSSPEERHIALTPLSLEIKKRETRAMNVSYPSFQAEINPSLPPPLLLPWGWEELVREGREVLPLLLELAALERGIVLLGEEIKRTRRKVNALEYRFIPELEKAIKYISLKLSELEKESIIRLMKIKEKITA